MIVDHLLTRSAVRSLWFIFAAIVPLATSYLLYTVAYKESPVDTLIHQIPIILRLLQSNTTINNLAFPHTTSSIVAVSSPVNAHPVSTSIFSQSFSDYQWFHLTEKESFSLSPAMLALASYLESQGLHDPVNIPGYQYLKVLQPLRAKLQPVLSFISSHKALAWIVSLLNLWMATEILFYIHFWSKLRQAQLIDRVSKGPRTNQDRKELFQRCLETVDKGEGAKRWTETWFDTGRSAQPTKIEEIGRSNMLQWLAWAFWAAPLEEIAGTPSNIIELNEMVDVIEASKEIKFAKGYNPNVESIRLAFDPVLASHRPLVYYGLVWAANQITYMALYLMGYTRHEGTTYGRSNVKQDPNTDLTYWIKTPTNPDNKIPLVFIHGIGVGMVQYIHWIVAMTTISRPIILIEVPYVSNNLYKKECMTPDETYFALERILKYHSYQKATFMGHSLGTMLCAAVCRASPASSPKSIIHGLILADPICFLTHHSLARNFAYRRPSQASELVMDLFAAREIGTSWFIMRRFQWDQCVMFPIHWRKRNEKPLLHQGRLSPVLPRKTRVFLSRKDNLLDMDLVSDYLKTTVGLREEKEELHVMDGMDHAQFMLHPSWFFKVLKAAEEC
ncbi:hypothetical protein BGZ76_002439 [Entomortierella beljakovae]|nr:hypothetical protein BGZ76_002439 [Entomortierella beljakovae]